jgi:hypothetical protein
VRGSDMEDDHGEEEKKLDDGDGMKKCLSKDAQL